MFVCLFMIMLLLFVLLIVICLFGLRNIFFGEGAGPWIGRALEGFRKFLEKICKKKYIFPRTGTTTNLKVSKEKNK
jgi:hypothetical protein